MAKIFDNVSQLIGNTPLLLLKNLIKKYDLKADILAKLEYFNPAGSIKDRIAKNMIIKAEKKGQINKDTVIIEPTSGNTGLGLAMIAASKGYKIIFTMPENMSIERQILLKAYGAKVVLTKANKGMQGAIDKAKELCKEYKNSFMPSQFENIANPDTHYNSTAPEIWNDTDGKIDILVAGIGTGGTITGTGKYLKEKNSNIKIIGVEPIDSPILSQNKAGLHKIQGIGAGFIPKILDTKIYDQIIAVKNEDAYFFAREIAKTEGVLVGISSGAAIFSAIQLANKKENAGKKIIVILPDTGERYISTDLYDDLK